MTIKEAVISFCGVEVSDSAIDMEIINALLNGSTTYVSGDASVVARIACNVLSGLLSLSSIKEGDLSIAYSREGISQRILFLANKYGFSDLINTDKPKVNDLSSLW